MKHKTLTRSGGATLHVLVFETGDEVMATLKTFAREHAIRAASFTAIGAFRSATLAFFDCEEKAYHDIPVREQTEVLVLAGDLAWKGDEPMPHVHVVLGRRDGSTIGGHLKEAVVRPTLELMLTEAGDLRREPDAASGLPLISLKNSNPS